MVPEFVLLFTSSVPPPFTFTAVVPLRLPVTASVPPVTVVLPW
jgi:hypothetical protein